MWQEADEGAAEHVLLSLIEGASRVMDDDRLDEAASVAATVVGMTQRECFDHLTVLAFDAWRTAEVAEWEGLRVSNGPSGLHAFVDVSDGLYMPLGIISR